MYLMLVTWCSPRFRWGQRRVGVGQLGGGLQWVGAVAGGWGIMRTVRQTVLKDSHETPRRVMQSRTTTSPLDDEALKQISDIKHIMKMITSCPAGAGEEYVWTLD